MEVLLVAMGWLAGFILAFTPFLLIPIFSFEAWLSTAGSNLVVRALAFFFLLPQALSPLVFVIGAFKQSTATGIAFLIGLLGPYIWLDKKRLDEEDRPTKQNTGNTYPPKPNVGRNIRRANQRTVAQSDREFAQLLRTGSIPRSHYSSEVGGRYKRAALTMMPLFYLVFFAHLLIEEYGRLDVSLLYTLLYEYPAVFFGYLSMAFGGALLPWVITGMACIVTTRQGKRFKWWLLYALYVLFFFGSLVRMTAFFFI